MIRQKTVTYPKGKTPYISLGKINPPFTDKEAIILTISEYEKLNQNTGKIPVTEKLQYENKIALLEKDKEYLKKENETLNKTLSEIKEKNSKLENDKENLNQKLTKVKDSFIAEAVITNKKYQYFVSELKALKVYEILFTGKKKKLIAEFEKETILNDTLNKSLEIGKTNK